MVTSFDTLSDELAPRLQEMMSARRGESVASAGGFARREAVRLAFPTFVAVVPTLLRSAIEPVADEFGRMNLNDLRAFLEKDAK